MPVGSSFALVVSRRRTRANDCQSSVLFFSSKTMPISRMGWVLAEAVAMNSVTARTKSRAGRGGHERGYGATVCRLVRRSSVTGCVVLSCVTSQYVARGGFSRESAFYGIGRKRMGVRTRLRVNFVRRVDGG